MISDRATDTGTGARQQLLIANTRRAVRLTRAALRDGKLFFNSLSVVGDGVQLDLPRKDGREATVGLAGPGLLVRRRPAAGLTGQGP